MKCPKPSCNGENLVKKTGTHGGQKWVYYYCDVCDDRISEQAVTKTGGLP